MSRKEKRVIVISEVYFPDDSATGYVMTRIAEGLSGFFPVLVFCGPLPHNKEKEGTDDPRGHNGVVVERCSATLFNKNVLAYRLVNLITVSISLFWKALLKLRENDSVIVVTNPPTLPFVVSWACRFRNANCSLLIHDVYPEVLTVAGLLRPDSILARVLGWLNKRLYRSVRRIIVLGRDMADLVSQKVDQHHKSIIQIPNWADLDQIYPEDRAENALLRRLGLAEKFVVQYSGNMGRTHGIEALLDCVKALSSVRDIQFLFAGTGAKKNWLESEVERAGLQNVTILPPQPRLELRSLLNACDVAIVSFMPGMRGISVPSRMYNIMAAGKPILALADEKSEIALVIQEHRIGWTVSPERPELAVEIVREIKKSPELLQEMGRRARSVALRNFDFSSTIESYRRLLEAEYEEDVNIKDHHDQASKKG